MAMIHQLYEEEEFITGDGFRFMCDIDCHHDNEWKRKIGLRSDKVLTVFCETHRLKNVIPILAYQGDKKFIMVTHNSDGQINYSGTETKHAASTNIDYTWNPAKNIAWWYSQNVNVNESNITPIPIALENEDITGYKEKRTILHELMEVEVKKLNKMYLCCNPRTNPALREKAYELYKDCSWAVCNEGYNNVSLFMKYFLSMMKYKFVLSPEGNGMDTVRTWEALYMGCIPIVFRRPFIDWFAERLPIIVIDSYDEITEKFLQSKAAEFEKRVFNYDLLRIRYWQEEIAKKKESLQPIKRECSNSRVDS